MEISIETLTGNTFELRVSPFETVISVKAKIQRLEGIPIAQQHLLWKNTELEDEYYLHDYGVSHGCTLQLVLAMRGGPISTRRVVLEDPSLQEVIDYVEANGDDMWNDLPLTDNTQVTVLLFRDGDQLNFFRVIEGNDGTLTPLSESLSGNSMYNLYDEDEESSLEDRSSENASMRDKVRSLQNKMRIINSNKRFTKEPRNKDELKKPSPPPRPPMAPLPPHLTPRPPSDLNGARGFGSVSSGIVRRRMYSRAEDIAYSKPDEVQVLPPLSTTRTRQLPKLTNKEDSNMSLRKSTTFEVGIETTPSTTAAPAVPSRSRISSARSISDLKNPEKLALHPVSATALKSASPIADKSEQYRRYGTSNKIEISSLSDPLRGFETIDGNTKQPPVVSNDDILTASREVSAKISSRLSKSKAVPVDASKIKKHVTYDINTRTNHVTTRDYSMTDGRKSVVHRLNSSDRKNLRTLQVLSRQGSVSPPTSPIPATKLPPVTVKTKVRKKKNVTRCSFCNKKTGLATTYTCHCEGVFCATHRYAEVHNCSYDYKTSGRKFLEQNNPVVMAPKLPKI